MCADNFVRELISMVSYTSALVLHLFVAYVHFYRANAFRFLPVIFGVS